MGILSAAAFAVRTTHHRNKQKNLGQLVLGRGMILPINHKANWKCICHWKQTQTEKDKIRKNSTRINYDYNIQDKFMVRRNQAYKYKTLFLGLYEIFQAWTYVSNTIQTGAVTA